MYNQVSGQRLERTKARMGKSLTFIRSNLCPLCFPNSSNITLILTHTLAHTHTQTHTLTHTQTHKHTNKRCASMYKKYIHRDTFNKLPETLSPRILWVVQAHASSPSRVWRGCWYSVKLQVPSMTEPLVGPSIICYVQVTLSSYVGQCRIWFQ